eukprot:1759767-Amphidinium_carterae.1
MASGSGTPATKRKTQVRAAHDLDTSVVKVPRKRQDAGVEAQVRKALYDHCRFWTKFQREIMVVDGADTPEQDNSCNNVMGKTFVETLTAAKILASQGKLLIGSSWWQHQRARFQDPDNQDPALNLSRLGLVSPPEPIYTHFKNIIKHPPQRTPLSMWCKSTVSITEGECIIVANCLKRLRPHGTGDQYSVGMDILTLLSRVSANIKYPDVVLAVHSVMDMCCPPFLPHAVSAKVEWVQEDYFMAWQRSTAERLGITWPPPAEPPPPLFEAPRKRQATLQRKQSCRFC